MWVAYEIAKDAFAIFGVLMALFCIWFFWPWPSGHNMFPGF